MQELAWGATAISAVVGLLAFCVAAYNRVVDGKKESERRDWERLQALAQVLHDGEGAGEWAQKLAIQELLSLRTKRVHALRLCREALDFWEGKGTRSSVLAELRIAVVKLSDN